MARNQEVTEKYLQVSHAIYGEEWKRTVSSWIDMIREFRNRYFEPRLNGRHNLLVVVRRNKGDRETFRPKSTGTTANAFEEKGT